MASPPLKFLHSCEARAQWEVGLNQGPYSGPWVSLMAILAITILPKYNIREYIAHIS